MTGNSLPRPGSTMFQVMRGDETQREKTISRFKFWNKWFVVPLYRANIAPLFGLGFIFVLLYHRGRKSGKQYFTPVEYRKFNGKYYVFASRGKMTDWYRNIVASPDDVIIKIGFRKHRPNINAELSVEERMDLLKYYVENYPKAAKYLMGWNSKTDTADITTLEPLATFIRIIEFDI